jgi:NodT family efflux transporter outer membrane factor (OMF) lipoprotein
MMMLTAPVAGCSTAHLSAPNVQLPAAYESGLASNTALPAQALDRWWLLYKDPQLTGLIEQALVASPNARTAIQRIGEARATRAQTLAGYLPQGDFGGTAQTQHTSESFGGLGIATGTTTGTTSAGATGSDAGSTGASSLGGAFLTPAGDLQTYAAQFNVSYELDLFGRHAAARRAADADVAAQRFDYEATRSSLATNVASNLFQARGYAVQLADAQETLRIARQLARASEISAAHGLTATSDSARLETDVATAQAEVARLEAIGRASRRTLLALIGRGTEPLDSLPVAAVAASPPDPPSVTPGDILRRRPDVREAEARLRSASATLKLDRLALFPTFNLAPGLQEAKTTGTYDSLTSIWTVGMNATLPLLDRPRLLAVIRGQKARGEEAVIAYEQAVQNAYRDAENGLSTLAGDRVRIARLQTGVDRARFAFDAKSKGYDLGLVDLTTLIEAERTWRLTRSTLTTAQIDALLDSATLFQALGGAWSPPNTKAPA